MGPAPGLFAAAEAYGAPEPTEEDYRRVRWAVAFWELDESAVDLLLAIEWCESSRRDIIIGRDGEEGRFQFMPSTWDRLQGEWAESPMAHYPVPLDAFDAYDATLMAAFLLWTGQCHEWTCCR